MAAAIAHSWGGTLDSFKGLRRILGAMPRYRVPISFRMIFYEDVARASSRNGDLTSERAGLLDIGRARDPLSAVTEITFSRVGKATERVRARGGGKEARKEKRCT